MKPTILLLCLLLAAPVFAEWTKDVAEVAERGPGGVLKKVWVVRNGAPIYKTRERKVISARLQQHAKAYHFGLFDGALIAVGDKPAKKDCRHHGYIAKEDVIVWDTDQALRFVGSKTDEKVTLFRDEAMTDKIGEASVEAPADPTVMPFPIFRSTAGGRGYEIAFIYTAASGADTHEARVQESLRRVMTKDITGIDVAFVMDVSGSMDGTLTIAKRKIRSLIEEFNSRKVEMFGQSRPLRMRFAFVGYRDRKEGENQWVEIVPFSHRGQMQGFEKRLQNIEAMSRKNDDWAENVVGGIGEALDLSWRKENAKAIILLGDAPPKDMLEWPKLLDQCRQTYTRLYAIAIETQPGSLPRTEASFKSLAIPTGGQCFILQQLNEKKTVDTIVNALAIEQAAMAKAPDIVNSWVEKGANLSSGIQEFTFRGVLPGEDQRPIPPTVFVTSKQDGFRQVCLFKSRANLFEMLGDMQTDFVGMIEDPSPDLLAAINAGGVEIIAELDPNVLQSIIALDDYSKASAEIKKMLDAMPALPGIIRELNEKGMAAEWHTLARKTTALSRFVSDPKNFYEDSAWVPFEVLDYGADE